jgi:hypothetical protein
MAAMELHKMLTEIVSSIGLLTANWTFEAILPVVLGSDMTGEVAWGGCAGKFLGTVIKRAMLDDRSIRA